MTVSKTFMTMYLVFSGELENNPTLFERLLLFNIAKYTFKNDLLIWMKTVWNVNLLTNQISFYFIPFEICTQVY